MVIGSGGSLPSAEMDSIIDIDLQFSGLEVQNSLYLIGTIISSPVKQPTCTPDLLKL